MRKLFFLLFLLLPVAAFCGDNKKAADNKKKNKLIQVSRWREIKRQSPDSAVVPFTDTLFISFQPKDSFSYHFRANFVYEGKYTISPDSILDFGTVRFKVLERKGESLVLVNQTGIYQLTADGSDTARTIVIAKNDTSFTPVSNIDQMIGHWTVYKRTTESNATINMVRNIRSVFVTGASTEGKLGYVYGGTDADNNPSWFIRTLSSDQTLQCDGAGPRTLKVNKCEKGELILEEDGVKYYFKQFR